MPKPIQGYRVRVVSEVTVFARTKADAKKRAEQRVWDARAGEYGVSAECAGWVACPHAMGTVVLSGDDPTEYGIEYDTDEEIYAAGKQPVYGEDDRYE